MISFANDIKQMLIFAYSFFEKPDKVKLHS